MTKKVMIKKTMIQVGHFLIPADELYERICDRIDSEEFHKKFLASGLDSYKPLDKLYKRIVSKMDSKRFNKELKAVGLDLEREYQRLKSCRIIQKNIKSSI